MKKFLILLSGVVLLSACSFDILGTPKSSSYLKNKGGGFVYDCKGGAIFKDTARFFWEANNLPKGTKEFVCVKGKAYLPGKEPK